MREQDLNASVYEAEVVHRLEHIRRYLRDFQRGRTPSLMVPLWNLRALQDESRQVGHRDISELCISMERSIMALEMRQDEEPDKLVAEIVRVGEYIRQRVHTLACGGEELATERSEGRLMEASNT